MEEIKTGTPRLNAALSKAQGAMTGVARDAKNPAFLRDGKPSTYATLAAVLDALREPFAANELAHWQATACDDNTVTVTTHLLHSSGEERASSFRVPVMKKDPQGFASATTYARRVSLMASAGLAPDDDDDGNSHSTDAKVRDAKTAPNPVRLGADVVTKWVDAFAAVGVDVPGIEARVGHPVGVMTKDDVATLKAFLAEKKPKDSDELAREAVKKQAEAAFASAQASLATPASVVKFEDLVTRIRAAKSAPEVTLIQAEGAKLSKGEVTALKRAAESQEQLLRARANPPTQTQGDVEF